MHLMRAKFQTLQVDDDNDGDIATPAVFQIAKSIDSFSSKLPAFSSNSPRMKTASMDADEGS